MKRAIVIAVLTLHISVCAMSQTADWHAVQALPAGTKIKVQLIRGRTFGHCIFNGASDNELTCTVEHSANYRHRYSRNNVKAVYIAHNGALIGFGVGATGGAILGASGKPVPGLGRGGTAVVTGGILGGLGAFAGMIADPFFHGKAIYRNRSNSPTIPAKSPQPLSPLRPSADEHGTQPEPQIPCLRDGTTLQCLNPQSVEPLQRNSD